MELGNKGTCYIYIFLHVYLQQHIVLDLLRRCCWCKMLDFMWKEQYKNTSWWANSVKFSGWESTRTLMIKTLIHVDWSWGEENGYIELTLEGYLDTSAMSYWTQDLVALKNVWLILQREWPWLHNWWQQCCGCQRRYVNTPSALPRDVLHWAHLDITVKEEQL